MALFSVARNKKDKIGSSRAPARAASKQRAFAALDIGSSKVACFIGIKEVGRSGAPLPVRVIGIGHQICRGLRSGAVIDMYLAEQSIRAAVDAAERMAKVQVQDVVVNLTMSGMGSYACSGHLDIDGREVEESDVSRVLANGCSAANDTGLHVVHAVPVGYRIDANRNISHPTGMYGEELGVDVNLVTVPPGPFRNLRACVERCHLDVKNFVVSPYASGLASLVEDELDLGATVIDMGSGTTSIAVFAEGVMQFAGVIPFGGQAVTNDIARGLSTPIEEAERMKALYGSAFGGPNDDKDMIRVPQVGEEDDAEGIPVPRSMLTRIIRPRLEETFEHVRDLIEANPKAQIASRRTILTGGASQMSGVKELAGPILEKQVRLGQPTKLTGLADATRGPAFSAAAGLLSFAANPPVDAALRAPENAYVPFNSKFEKFRSWLW
jgi:cell division protein FtsA